MIKERFAENLKKFRKSKKMTQEKLAEIVGVDFRYISFLENAKGFPSCELIEKLSNALQINVSVIWQCLCLLITDKHPFQQEIT